MKKCKCPKMDCWDEIRELARCVARLQRKLREVEKAVIQLQTGKDTSKGD
jgi:hypothetical protein